MKKIYFFLNLVIFLIVSAASIGLSSLIFLSILHQKTLNQKLLLNDSIYKLGGEFTMIGYFDQNTYSNESFKGKTSLLYFGSLLCDDSCSENFDKIVKAHILLKDLDIATNVIFISLDPNNPIKQSNTITQNIKSDPEVFILYNKEEHELKKIADLFELYFTTSQYEDSVEIEHNSYIYILDKNTDCINILPNNTSAEEIVAYVQLFQNRPVN